MLTVTNKPQKVLSGSDKSGNFDCYSAAFPSIIKDNNKFFLYYTGSPDKNWSFASIGVASSVDGIFFERQEAPVLTNQLSSDFAMEAVTPAIAKLKSKYFMAISGRKHRYNRRVVGIACSENPEGPFTLIKIIHKPTLRWEGFSIDNGTAMVQESDNSLLLYYSNCAPPLTDIILRRPIRRNIGTLRLTVTDSGSELIKVTEVSEKPISGLSGNLGEWNESVFCPGYIQHKEFGLLFFAGSTYSKRFCPQAIGYAFVDPVAKDKVLGSPQMLINRDHFEKYKGSTIAFDSPAPILDGEENIRLFYTVMDRNSLRWEIMANIVTIL